MLLATLLLPVLTGAPGAAEPTNAHDPRRFDLSYEVADPVPEPLQMRDDWDTGRRVGRPYMPWYLGVHGGFTSTRTSNNEDVEVDFDEGYLLGIALGRRFGEHSTRAASWAGELELIWTDQDVERSGPGPIVLQGSSDVTVLALYLNGLFDFLFTERFGAYGGAGIGAAWVDVGGFVDDPLDFEDESGPHLTWQLKAGLQWLFAERAALRLGYRFLNVDDVELDENAGDASFDLETRQHVIELGLLFGF